MSAGTEYQDAARRPAAPGRAHEPAGLHERTAGPGSAAAQATGPGRLGLALILVASFMVVLDFSIVNVALPSIQRELGISAATVQWVVTAYAIALGGLLILGGRAATSTGGAACSWPGSACSPPRPWRAGSPATRCC